MKSIAFSEEVCYNMTVKIALKIKIGEPSGNDSP